MAKRFTDTEKWKRPWYRKLPPHLRELWNYILDSCDHAGIWIEDLELAEMMLGYTIDPRDYEEYLGPKLIRVDDDKVFVPSFVEFQYGKLNLECKTHRSVIKILETYGIDTVSYVVHVPLQLPNPTEGFSKSIDTLKDKDKDKDKEKDKDQKKDQEGGSGGKQDFQPEGDAPSPVDSPPPQIPRLDFKSIYQEYPRRDGKQEGLKHCKAQIKTQEQYDQLLSAVRRYRAHCEQEGTDKKFIKHFSTFMCGGKWRDWLDPETGTSVVQATVRTFNRAEMRSEANRHVLQDYLNRIGGENGQKD